MKYAALFFVLGMSFGFFVPTSESLATQVVLANAAISFLGVAIGYGFLGPRVFMKKPDGRMNLLSNILFWPYYLMSFLNLLLFRAISREHPYDQIGDNLFLGCRLFRTDKRRLQDLGISAVLDVTSEFAELQFLREETAYQCIAVLDTRPPTLSELERGVQWLAERVPKGPTYVHCALGHGRSATFVTAYLLHSNRALDLDGAIAVVKTGRPGIGLHKGQLDKLKEFKKSLDNAS